MLLQRCLTFSELVALVEAVALSELTTEDVTEVDATATVELATEVDAAVVYSL